MPPVKIYCMGSTIERVQTSCSLVMASRVAPAPSLIKKVIAGSEFNSFLAVFVGQGGYNGGEVSACRGRCEGFASSLMCLLYTLRPKVPLLDLDKPFRAPFA